MNRSSRYVRVVQAIALIAGVSTAGCASAVTGTGDASSDTVTNPTDVASRGDDSVDAPRLPCDCCPTGDWSGRCLPDFQPADASQSGLPPPAGHRWCVEQENLARMCPVAGPLAPPELAA